MDQPGNHILLRGNQPGAADRMRELLARTVQDHVADQRSNASALEDIRQRMEGLEWLVKEVREREIPGMTDRLDGLTRHLDETTQRPPQWAESLAEHIEVLRAQLAPVAELPSLWADVGAVSANVAHALPQLQVACDTIGQAMEVLRAQDERLTTLHRSVSKLQHSMESAAGRFSRLDKAIAELTQRTGRLDQEISQVKGHAEAGFSTLASKIEGLAENVAGIGEQVGVLGGQVQVVHGRIERLDERIERLDERLADTDDKLGSKIGSTDARVAALDTRLERLDERLDDQYDRVSAIDHTLGGTDTKLGAIGNTLAATDTRIGVAEAALVAADTKLGALDTRMERLDDRLGEHGRGLTSVDGKLSTVAGRLDPVDGKLSALDGKVGTLGGRLDGLDGRLEGVGARIDGLGDKFGSLDGGLRTANGRFTDVDGKLESLGQQMAAVGEQLTDQLEPLADELRSRPGHGDIQDTLAKVVDAAQNDVTTQLGSLEETVLTLAEALLRPNGRQIPGPREGNRI